MLKRSSDVATLPQTNPGSCEVQAVNDDRVHRARQALLTEPTVLEDVANAFKVLSHSRRIHLLQALSVGELCVCELAEVVGLSMSATSHQLRDLRRLKIVNYRMEGRLAFYSIRDPFVLSLLDAAAKYYTERAAS